MTTFETLRVVLSGKALTSTGFDDPRMWTEAGITAKEDPTFPRRRGYAYDLSVADAKKLLVLFENSPALPSNGGDAAGPEVRSITAAIKKLAAAIDAGE